LRDKAADRRLGLSVIGRPAPAVCQRFAAFLDQLKQVAPRQYFYQASEFHLTVLSLFTATEDFSAHWADRAVYRAAVDRALHNGHSFTVRYEGITASNSAVMVQGFAQEPGLDRLRTELRRALPAFGLADGLDQRYAIETAHSTVLRFSSQPRDMPQFLTLLQAHRTADFGLTTFDKLQLVKNDWYMSAGKVEILAEYSLS
jgi:2'-5' RNA ligase